MFRGLSIKIWLPFTVILTVIAIGFNWYYPRKQESFYLQNKNNELKELAKTVGLGVELSLSEQNFQGLKKTLDFAATRKDFEFIAIVVNEGSKQRVFASYPTLSEKKILKTDSEKYIYQQSKFASNELNGYILIAASKKKMDKALTKLNRPIYVSTAVIFVLTILFYILIARRITRPLNALVKVTEEMRKDNYTADLSDSLPNDEIGQLGNSIQELQTKLQVERKKNQELYESLEEQILQRTAELSQTTQNLIESQNAAAMANFSFDYESGTTDLPFLFYELMGLSTNLPLDLRSFLSLLPETKANILDRSIREPKIGERFTEEIRFITESGTVAWLWMSGTVKKSPKSDHFILQGILQNITERKNFEAEIRELSLVAKNTSNCVIITDSDKKIVWINESVERLSGYSREEIIGSSPKMFQYEKTDPATLSYIKSKLDNQESVNCEIQNISKHGHEYWLELNIVPLRDESGALYGYMAVETDITEIKNTAIELEQREKELIRILDSSSEMIHTLDELGNIVWANRSWKANMGISDDDLKNKNILEFLDKSTKEEFEVVMPRLTQGEIVSDLSCGFYTTSGELIHLRGRTIPLFSEDKFIGSQAYLHNITEIVRSQEELRSIANMQKLLMEISVDFLDANENKTGLIVVRSLKKISEFVQAERIIISNLIGDQGIFNSELNRLAAEENFSTLEVTNDLTKTVETAHSLSHDAQLDNRISIPLQKDNQVVAELIIYLAKDRRPLKLEIELLQLFSTMLINVEQRYLFTKALSQAKSEIEDINVTLEQRIIENTKRNIELSKTIVDQEKMATIGEITAGIAHDLNTPLGSIKVGAESIAYSLDMLFKHFTDVPKEDLVRLIETAQNRKIEIFVGGIQVIKESKEMTGILKSSYNLDDDAARRIAELLVKCRIRSNETEIIAKILSFNDPVASLEVLYALLTVNSMLSAVSDSVMRATDVVQNVRSFIKKDILNGLQRNAVDLKENIRIVLNIFNYEFKKNVHLEVSLEDNLIIQGFDVKLFQLWSNLIKNAIDAMEDKKDKKLIVKSQQDQQKIYISIANNGAMIPEDVQSMIFKKFFSTKTEKNGTGLGLSIVQSVVQEHHAKINLDSTKEWTTFTIEFDKPKS
jgi:PAS domain S-box-containing protein